MFLATKLPGVPSIINFFNLRGWKAELTLQPPNGLEPGTAALGIHCPNHLAIGPLEYSKSSKFIADTHNANTEKQPHYAKK